MKTLRLSCALIAGTMILGGCGAASEALTASAKRAAQEAVDDAVADLVGGALENLPIGGAQSE